MSVTVSPVAVKPSPNVHTGAATVDHASEVVVDIVTGSPAKDAPVKVIGARTGGAAS